MATFDMVPCTWDPADTNLACRSAKVDTRDNTGTKLRRLARFGGSNHPQGTQQECEGFGIGYTWHADWKSCYYPCPPSYLQDPSDMTGCVARPLLTDIDLYYETLQDASKSCFEKSSAYKEAVLKSGKDPSAIRFTDDCPNPFSCVNDTFADATDLPPLPNNTGEVVPLNSDPNGTSGVAGTVDTSKYPQAQCKNGQWQPFIPEPPFTPLIDSSGGVGEPSSRLTLTIEDIEKIPKVEEYNSDPRESTLAKELKRHPTLLDVNPLMIKDYMAVVPDFTWSCVITQENFDRMPEGVQCGLVKHYFTYVTDPKRVVELRSYDPTVLITRDAPPTVAPVFANDLETKRRTECEARSNGGTGGCKWKGDCEGVCDCPNPKPPEAPYPDAPAPPEGSSIWLIGGVAVFGIVALMIGFQVYKVATPTGRAMSNISEKP